MKLEDTNNFLLNGQEYSVSVSLSNPDKELLIPKNNFIELMFKESSLNWPFKGYFDYDDSFEQIERFKESSDRKNSELFYFRRDGTDKINVYLYPILKSDDIRSDSEYFNNMFLKFSGSIYDVEDLFLSNIGMKVKRLYFWDDVYHKATEITTNISTSEYVGIKEKRSTINLKDIERSVETGSFLKYIFEDKLNAKTSKDIWDVGVNKIFHTSPAIFNINDNINHVVASHLSDQEYPALLRYNRFKDEYEFLSFNFLFNTYNDQLKERFMFHDKENEKAPIGPFRTSGVNCYNLKEGSVIDVYKYTKMAPLDNMKAVCSKSVNWYDRKRKIFKTSMEKNSAEYASEKMSDLVSHLNTSRSKPMFPLNKMKMENKSIETIYSTGSYENFGAMSKGLNNILCGSLFLNDCIHFTALGNLLRTSSTFMEIDSEYDLQGSWEDRFLGSWFIVEVTHVFTSNLYHNDIVAIKPNATEDFEMPSNV